MSEEIKESKELSQDEKITIKNLASWEVAFNKLETTGHVIIPSKGQVRCVRSEVIAQVNNNNKLIAGLDDIGSHATIYIEDAATRESLEFDLGKRKQKILDKSKVIKLFKIVSLEEFKNEVRDAAVTRCEKSNLLDYIKELKLNEYDKIVFCQEHCKFSLFD